MGVRVIFECGGCDAIIDGTGRLRAEFRSFSGRSHGVGGAVLANNVLDVVPEDWVAFDPYTYATYCPRCWAEIISDEPKAPTP